MDKIERLIDEAHAIYKKQGYKFGRYSRSQGIRAGVAERYLPEEPDYEIVPYEDGEELKKEKSGPISKKGQTYWRGKERRKK